jgi:hypothetical protein
MLGNGFTVTTIDLVQPVLTSVAIIVAVPAATPVTTPVEEPTVAILVALLLHVTALSLVIVMVLFTHTAVGPAITDGDGFTVIGFVR